MSMMTTMRQLMCLSVRPLTWMKHLLGKCKHKSSEWTLVFRWTHNPVKESIVVTVVGLWRSIFKVPLVATGLVAMLPLPHLYLVNITTTSIPINAMLQVCVFVFSQGARRLTVVMADRCADERGIRTRAP